MNDTDAQELINRSLDGELDAAEQERLDQLLRDDPQFLREYESSRRLFTLLQSVPSAEPEKDFAATIAATLEKQRHDAMPSNVVRPQFGKRLKPALALAATLVVAVAVALVVENGQPIQQEQLMGTMAPVSLPEGWVSWQNEQVLLNIPGSGEFELQLRGEGLHSGQQNLFIEPTEHGVRITGTAPFKEELPIELARGGGDIELTLTIEDRSYRGRLER